MKSESNRAELRETVDLVIRFVDAALRYRFLYVQNRTDGPHHVDAVQRAVLDSIQKAHTNAQALLRTIEACGLPASESHDAWRMLSIGLPDASYADCERALKNWAKAASEAVARPAVATQPPQDGPLPPGKFRINGKTFHLTPQQYTILVALWKAEGRKMRRAKLIAAVWKKDMDDYAVDKAVERLKKVLYDAKAGMDIHMSSGFFLLK